MDKKTGIGRLSRLRNKELTLREKTVFIYVIPALLMVALLISGIWGDRQRRRAEEYRSTNEAIYTQAYIELADSMHNMSAALSKLLVSKAPATITTTLDDIWRESGTIVAIMGRIPQSHAENVELNRFLAQIGDYAHSLAAGLLRGGELADKDMEQLKKLYAASELISKQTEQKLEDGDIPLEALDLEAFFAYDATGAENSNGMREENAEYPTPDYDGPLSNSTEQLKAKVLEKEKIDEDGAHEKAKYYLDMTDGELKRTGLISSSIPFYGFEYEDKNGGLVEIEVCENGGELVSMRSAYVRDDEKEEQAGENSFEEAARIALEWLNKHGYEKTEPVSYQFYPGITLVEFVPVLEVSLDAAENEDELVRSKTKQKSKIKICSDKLRVWVDTGKEKVVGLDAADYLKNKTERSFKKGIMSIEAAKKNLSSEFKVQKTELALLPLPDLSERLCYEFTGTAMENEYIVYVDAATGEEICVCRTITDENGVKTLR